MNIAPNPDLFSNPNAVPRRCDLFEECLINLNAADFDLEDMPAYFEVEREEVHDDQHGFYIDTQAWFRYMMLGDLMIDRKMLEKIVGRKKLHKIENDAADELAVA